MAQYSNLIGQRVEVDYRAGDVLLTATGKMAADTGKSIFLEEHSDQKGKTKTFRWEIPYPCILSVAQSLAPANASEQRDAESSKSEQHPVRANFFKTRPHRI
jgi:hypothetical protein